MPHGSFASRGSPQALLDHGTSNAVHPGMKPKHYAELVSLLFAAQAVFVIIHRLTNAEYPGYVHAFGAAVDEGHALLWLAAATAAMFIEVARLRSSSFRSRHSSR